MTSLIPKQTAAAIMFGIIITGLLGCAATGLKSKDPAIRRNALIKEAAKGDKAIPAIANAINDPNPLIRNTAIRLLSQKGDAAMPQLTDAIDSSDTLVRRNAFMAISNIKGKDMDLEIIRKALNDSDQSVRMVIVTNLASVKPVTPERMELLKKAASDKDPAIRNIASKATWPYYRNTVLLKDRPDWDHEVRVIQDITLPKDNWRFNLDRTSNGHTSKWFATDFNDSAWKAIPIEATWESAGIKYDGIAWYRKSFKAPKKSAKFNAVELKFDSVDECAWVWLNGIYIGQHDIGPAGWTIPFSLDITREIKWGDDNQITVRVLDTAGAGGIYKPVHLQVME